MSKHSSVLFYHIRVWEIPKMDFCENLIFAGLGTQRICLLSANNRSGYPSAVLAGKKNQSLGNRSFADVSGQRICLLI